MIRPRSVVPLTLSRRTGAVLFSIAVVAFALRLLGIGRGIWLDEAETLRALASGQLDWTVLGSGDQLPTYYMLLKAWSIFARTDWSLRLLSVILGVVTVVALMAWLRAYSLRVAIIGGAIGALTPLFLRDSLELRSYALVIPAMAVGLYFCQRIVAHPSSAIGYVGLATSLTVGATAHPTAALVIPTAGAFLLTQRPRLQLNSLIRVAFAFCVPTVAFAVLFTVYCPPETRALSASYAWMPAASLGLLTDVAASTFGYGSLGLPIYFVQAHLPELRELAVLMVAGVTVLALGGTLRGNWRLGIPMLLAAVTYWLGLVAYSFVQAPVLTPQTAAAGLVPFVGFLAVQLGTAEAGRLTRLAQAALALLGLFSAVTWVKGEASRPLERWNDLGAALAADHRPGDLVVFFPDYAVVPVRHYVPGLNSDDILGVSVDRNVDLAAIARVLDERSGPVDLVVREQDAKVQRSVDEFSTLQAMLVERHGLPNAWREMDGVLLASFP